MTTVVVAAATTTVVAAAMTVVTVVAAAMTVVTVVAVATTEVAMTTEVATIADDHCGCEIVSGDCQQSRKLRKLSSNPGEPSQSRRAMPLWLLDRSAAFGSQLRTRKLQGVQHCAHQYTAWSSS